MIAINPNGLNMLLFLAFLECSHMLIVNADLLAEALVWLDTHSSGINTAPLWGAFPKCDSRFGIVAPAAECGLLRGHQGWHLHADSNWECSWGNL